MVYIDSSIACIIARELLEATMFINSFFLAIWKNTKIDNDAKMTYYKYCIFGILSGLTFGAAIAIGVGFGLKSAFQSGDGLEAEVGIEAGEAVSKLIGCFIVIKMMLKAPKWFGISNYGRVENQEYQRPNSPMQTHSEEEALESEKAIAFTLFWNILREIAEAGCFVAIEVFLSDKAMESLGSSVGVGISAAVGFFLLIVFSTNQSNNLFAAILISVILQMLAVGLFTGSVHAFEEVSELRGTGHTDLIWGDEDMDKNVNNTIKVFGFFGLRGKFSAATFGAWISSIVLLTYIQIRHNYYGLPILPFVDRFTRSANKNNEDSKMNDDQKKSEIQMEEIVV